jgi:hypothetical protein
MSQGKKAKKKERPTTDIATTTTTIQLSKEELKLIESLPMCPHGRRIGFHPCPWCMDING